MLFEKSSPGHSNTYDRLRRPLLNRNRTAQRSWKNCPVVCNWTKSRHNILLIQPTDGTKDISHTINPKKGNFLSVLFLFFCFRKNRCFKNILGNFIFVYISARWRRTHDDEKYIKNKTQQHNWEKERMIFIKRNIYTLSCWTNDHQEMQNV